MNRIAIIFAVLSFLGCVHDGARVAHHSGEIRNPAQETVNRDGCNEEKFRTDNTDSQGPTVWDLQAMAKQKQFTKLNDLFNNHGIIDLNCLPVGYAAGAGAQVLGLGGKLEITDVLSALDIDVPDKIEEGLVALTGQEWQGKIFFAQGSEASEGLNRIREKIYDLSSPIIPQAHFKTQLIKFADMKSDMKSLVPSARTNVVLLNYAKPVSNSSGSATTVEEILKAVQVYDVMVPIKGKYGPVYVGETWLGYYDGSEAFHAFTKKHLIARYFLDFNPAALEEQRTHHWPANTQEVPSSANFSEQTTQAQLVRERAQ